MTACGAWLWPPAATTGAGGLVDGALDRQLTLLLVASLLHHAFIVVAAVGRFLVAVTV